MKRTLVGMTAVAALTLAALLPGTAGSTTQACGLTTIDGVLRDPDGDGVLECLSPGEPIAEREDLAQKTEGASPSALDGGVFMTLADFQLADEESPLRGEWADKCESHPATAAFRPHETTVPHMMNAHVRAADAIAANGSPKLDRAFDFVVSLGDLADNQQYNEVRAFIDILDGGGLVDPDSGAEGYEGVQGVQPEGAGGLSALVPGGDILNLANEPFYAAGLRYTDAEGVEHKIPWYSVMGNHDMKVQGTVTDAPGWREFARAWVTGQIKVNDLAPDHQQRLCGDPSQFFNPEFWMAVAANPGTTKIVTADADRRLLDRAQWMAEHDDTTGVPAGHGFGAGRCADEGGVTLERACYAFSEGDFRYVTLDTNAAEGLENGNIDTAQFEWLERELQAASTSYYDENGTLVENPGGEDRLIVVFAHHTISSTNNYGGVDKVPGAGGPVGQQLKGPLGIKDGTDLKNLLLRFPNVVLQADGHTHQNKIWTHDSPHGDFGYYEVNTSAIADFPHQSRTIEIADNGDGTLSIFAVVFDARVPADPRTVDWAMDDPTDETLAGAAQAINEDWLASAGREIGFGDPQADLTAIGTPQDRNVELVLPRPLQPDEPLVPDPGLPIAQERSGKSLPAGPKQ